MSTRAAVTTRIRFEVFKRDKFTCQYCGRKAPEVILHVDHVEPVAEGGTADVVNLGRRGAPTARGVFTPVGSDAQLRDSGD